MIKGVRRLAIASVALFAMASIPAADVAHAALLTWDFGGGWNRTIGPYGNTRTFTANAGTTTVTANAWGLTGGASNTLFESAYLGQYSYGLGVTNRDEGYGRYPSHTMDNVGRLDVVAFYFDSTVQPLGAFLYAFSAAGLRGDPDSDISVWVGNVTSMPDLTGLTIGDLDSLYGPHIDNAGPRRGSRVAIVGGEPTGNLMLISARVSEFLHGTGEDLIKIKKLAAKTVDVPTVHVPEPGSLALFAMGLTILGMVTRRRRARAAPR